MARHQKKIILIIVILFSIILFYPVAKSFAQNTVSEELIDFSYLDDESNFYEKIDGNWNFYERQLLLPSETGALKEGSKMVTIPDSFEVHTGDVNTYGTYQTKVKIPRELIGETLAILVPFQYSAYALFVDDHLVAENGEVGVDSASHKAEMAPRVGYFIAQSDEVELTMQISSFKHIRGGFENPIFIGDSSTVSQKNNTNIIVNLFLNGSIFIGIIG